MEAARKEQTASPWDGVWIAIPAYQEAGTIRTLATEALAHCPRVIVVDDATCMVALTLKFSNFFKVESCGQCPPCRMGTINLAALMTKIEQGEGTEKDMESLLQLCGFVKGTGYCTLVTGAAVLVQSSMKLFRHEFEEHIRLQRCPYQPLAAGAMVH